MTRFVKGHKVGRVAGQDWTVQLPSERWDDVGAAGCGVIVRLENSSHGEADEPGAVGREPRAGMSVSSGKLPGLFLSNPSATPPTRHLGRKRRNE